MSVRSQPPPGQLMVWTDIDAMDEPDFNRWYDREHMQERVALPGFRCARRYHALHGCPRPYLALYDTEQLTVFDSDAYRNAFEKQTEWSRRNFSRMRNPQRRVGEREVAGCRGEGGMLALFVVGGLGPMSASLRQELDAVVEREHIVCASILQTEPRLSGSLTGSAAPVVADAVVMVEATHADAVIAAAEGLAELAEVEREAVHAFRLLWRIGA